MRPVSTRRRGAASLAEMLIGMLLVSGTLLVVLGLFPSAYGCLIQAKTVTQATNLARLTIERQKSTPYPQVTAFPDTPWGINCTVYGRTVAENFTYRLDVIADPSNLDRYKDLVVTVGWNSGGAAALGLAHTVTLQTEVPNW